MFLSNRDIRWAIERGKLIVRPQPEEFNSGYDETSIDLHLGPVTKAKVWDVVALMADQSSRGASAPEVHIGRFNLADFAERYLVSIPEEAVEEKSRPAQVVSAEASRLSSSRAGFYCG